MRLADLRRLDELAQGGAVAREMGGYHSERRRTRRAAAAQPIDEWRDVPTAGAMEIDGDTVVQQRREIAGGSAHPTEDERRERSERARIAVLNR